LREGLESLRAQRRRRGFARTARRPRKAGPSSTRPYISPVLRSAH